MKQIDGKEVLEDGERVTVPLAMMDEQHDRSHQPHQATLDADAAAARALATDAHERLRQRTTSAWRTKA